jgi:hypothetical protein
LTSNGGLYEIVAIKVLRGVCENCECSHAYLTYEENRIYQVECKKCSYTSSEKLDSWHEATQFFFGKPFSSKQQKLMEHALGLDWDCKPSRNYYETSDDNEDWNALVTLGFAERIYENKKISKKQIQHFRVSETGKFFLTVWAEQKTTPPPATSFITYTNY